VEILTVATLALLFAFMVLAFFIFSQMNKGMRRMEDGVGEKLNWLTQQVDGRLRDNSQSVQNASVELGSKLESAVKAVTNVHQHLGKMEESNRQIYELGKEMASLQDLLRAPKMRGGIGEFFLEDLLKQVLPPESVAFQYEFKSREKVDAVIKFGQGIVPIDAKFPLENFRRYMQAEDEKEKAAHRKMFTNDVKIHIKAISDKYILPDEGTFDFALMYIPAENVYYETILKDDKFGDSDSLYQYALSRKVMPVSPNSLYAYLGVILLGLKGLAVEKGARRIIENISKLRNELGKFHEDFTKVGKHLNNSRSSFDEAGKHLTKFSEKLKELESTPVENPASITRK